MRKRGHAEVFRITGARQGLPTMYAAGSAAM